MTRRHRARTSRLQTAVRAAGLWRGLRRPKLTHTAVPITWSCLGKAHIFLPRGHGTSEKARGCDLCPGPTRETDGVPCTPEPDRSIRSADGWGRGKQEGGGRTSLSQYRFPEGWKETRRGLGDVQEKEPRLRRSPCPVRGPSVQSASHPAGGLNQGAGPAGFVCCHLVETGRRTALSRSRPRPDPQGTTNPTTTSTFQR